MNTVTALLKYQDLTTLLEYIEYRSGIQGLFMALWGWGPGQSMPFHTRRGIDFIKR